ncbi:MAG TPA: lipid kinase [Bacteroidales bacterium]|nr:lipid kinase [Bacteroidales bacterium]
MKKIKLVLLMGMLLIAIGLAISSFTGGVPVKEAPVPAPKEFTVVWSIYAGWNPWAYAQTSGILDKWAAKNNIKIKLVRMDYMPSIEAFTTPSVDACVMTNMDCLTIPVAGGISCSAIIVGDYSNGNDALIVRNNLTIPQLKGKKVNLVQFSVSHYMLSRALDMNGMTDDDVKIINVSDSDIGPAFIANKDQEAVVTWNPLVMEIMKNPGVKKIFDSSQIPGEILDLMVVKTKVLQASPELGKALAGAWFEVMNIMSSRTDKGKGALEEMAKAGGSSLIEYQNQLKTTAMFYKASDAVTYTNSEEIKTNMRRVRNFCSKYELLGAGVKADDLGIKFSDGTVIGNQNKILFIYDAVYMQGASK